MTPEAVSWYAVLDRGGQRSAQLAVNPWPVGEPLDVHQAAVVRQGGNDIIEWALGQNASGLNARGDIHLPRLIHPSDTA